MDTPICIACTQPQRGIVEFRWSEGAVVYECTQCGAFNEVSAVPRRAVTRSSRRPFGLGVTVSRYPSPDGLLQGRNFGKPEVRVSDA